MFQGWYRYTSTSSEEEPNQQPTKPRKPRKPPKPSLPVSHSIVLTAPQQPEITQTQVQAPLVSFEKKPLCDERGLYCHICLETGFKSHAILWCRACHMSADVWLFCYGCNSREHDFTRSTRGHKRFLIGKSLNPST